MNTDTPLISIVTPTYERAQFIGETIESVLAQSYPHFELIIIDDGSTDDTESIVKSYDDDRIIYKYQENQGQSPARNAALALAKGEFVCFLDSDNIWMPDKLETQLKVFREKPDVDIVYGDLIEIDENGNEISRENMARYSGRIAGLLLKDNFVSNNTSMTRAKCFQELGVFRLDHNRAVDYDMWLRFASRYVYEYLPEYMAYYRIMEDQISSDKTGRFKANEAFIKEFVETYPDAVTDKERKEGFCTFYVRRARYYMSVGDHLSALKDLFRASQYQFFSTRTLRAYAKWMLSVLRLRK